MTLYMVVENFRNGDPVPVYRRLRDRGYKTKNALKGHMTKKHIGKDWIWYPPVG